MQIIVAGGFSFLGSFADGRDALSGALLKLLRRQRVPAVTDGTLRQLVVSL